MGAFQRYISMIKYGEKGDDQSVLCIKENIFISWFKLSNNNKNKELKELIDNLSKIKLNDEFTRE